MNTHIIQWRKAEGKRFSTVIAGDFCPREENSIDVASRAEEITAPVKPFFQSADLRLLQWECAVTKSDTPIAKSGPNHRCYPECVSFAGALGIDAVLLANNHTGDFGLPGIKDTLAAFREKTIGTAGLGLDRAAAEKPLILERNGLAVAVLNAAEHEFGIAEKGQAGVNGLEPFRLCRQIREAKDSKQTVIVALHGGHEHFGFPSPRMKELCRFLAAAGADAVFNCHTHCPLGYEVWHSVPIVYCPGNFYFPSRAASLPSWSIGYLPKFHFDEKGAWQLELLPYFNFREAIRTMDEKTASEFFSYLDTLSAPIADDARLQKLFDAWCLRSGLNGYLLALCGNEKPVDWQSEETIKNWLRVRNVFTCESHRDLLRNTLLLIQHHLLKQAEAALPEIEAQQRPAWLEKILGKK